MKKTVSILPETEGASLCVRFSETVTAEDYTTCFSSPLEKIVEEHSYCNVLIHFDKDFVGWTPDAAALSFKNISTYVPKARKIAYINAPDSRMLLVKMLEPVTAAETRFFDTTELAQALKWVRE